MGQIIWGRWYSEEELQALAKEMNSIGKRIEIKTKPTKEWIEEVEQLRKKNPHNLVF